MNEKSVKIESMDELETAFASGAKAIELGKDISDKVSDDITNTINHGRLTGKCPYHDKPLIPTGCVVDGPKQIYGCPDCSYTADRNLTPAEMADYSKSQRMPW
jgi:hypothetical protein